MSYGTDVDIDVADRDKALSNIQHVQAMMDVDGLKKRHNTGIYLQDMPFDPYTGLALIDYKNASEVGYFKLDILNNHVYDDIKNEEHLDILLNMSPNWELLQHDEVVSQLFHISNYSYLTKRLKPSSIDELAMLLAIIRPAKAHLQNAEWSEIRSEVWKKTNGDTYEFKKSHAIAYAFVIVVQLNRIVEKLINVL